MPPDNWSSKALFISRKRVKWFLSCRVSCARMEERAVLRTGVTAGNEPSCTQPPTVVCKMEARLAPICMLKSVLINKISTSELKSVSLPNLCCYAPRLLHNPLPVPMYVVHACFACTYIGIVPLQVRGGVRRGCPWGPWGRSLRKRGGGVKKAQQN